MLRDGAVIGSTTQTTFTDAGLIANGSHTYAVRAVDAAGNLSATTTVQHCIFDNTPPDIPINVSAANPTNRPNVTWTASLDSGGSGGVVYSVYRDGGGSPIATTSGTSYLDTSLLSEGPHAYAVVATDAAGNASAQSLPFSVTVDVTPPDPVAAPTGATPTQPPGTLLGPGERPLGHRALRRLPGIDPDRVSGRRRASSTPPSQPTAATPTPSSRSTTPATARSPPRP